MKNYALLEQAGIEVTNISEVDYVVAQDIENYLAKGAVLTSGWSSLETGEKTKGFWKSASDPEGSNSPDQQGILVLIQEINPPDTADKVLADILANKGLSEELISRAQKVCADD